MYSKLCQTKLSQSRAQILFKDAASDRQAWTCVPKELNKNPHVP